MDLFVPIVQTEQLGKWSELQVLYFSHFRTFLKGSLIDSFVCCSVWIQIFADWLQTFHRKGRKNTRDMQPIIVGWILRGGCWTVSPIRTHYMHPVNLKCPSGTVHTACKKNLKYQTVTKTILWKLFVQKSQENKLSVFMSNCSRCNPFKINHSSSVCVCVGVCFKQLCMIVLVIPNKTLCSALRNAMAVFNNGFKSGDAL